MKAKTLVLQGLLQSFVAISALIGGILLMVSPDGGLLEMPLEMLATSPFETFFVPGLILLSVIGVGNAIGAVLSLKENEYAGQSGIFFGCGLMIWLAVQVVMIGLGSWLQPLYFVFGAIELILGITIYRGRARTGETWAGVVDRQA